MRTQLRQEEADGAGWSPCYQAGKRWRMPAHQRACQVGAEKAGLKVPETFEPEESRVKRAVMARTSNQGLIAVGTGQSGDLSWP